VYHPPKYSWNFDDTEIRIRRWPASTMQRHATGSGNTILQGAKTHVRHLLF